MATYSLGLDLGSHAARAAIVDCADGTVKSMASADYAHGVAGVMTNTQDPDIARQAPSDFITASCLAIAEAVRAIEAPEDICGVGVCATGSTPIPIDDTGTPIADHPDCKDTLSAQAWMWKDHSAADAAADITRMISDAGLPHLSSCGGTYSSEWYWAKLLHCARASPDVAAKTDSWIELQDFLPAQMTGQTDSAKVPRGQCAAGHKGLYSTAWHGWPDLELLEALHPDLVRWRARLPDAVTSAGSVAGYLTTHWAEATGLACHTPVSVGLLDAHSGAVGAGVKPGRLVKIVGTSSCDIAVAQHGTLDGMSIAGLCGAVESSVLPHFIGLEAGQAAVGDLFEWVARLFSHPGESLVTTFERLMAGAAALMPGESGLLALDWNNGNRSILMDTALSGLLLGQGLHTTEDEIFRAMLEASAFGSRMILQTLQDAGAEINEVILTGGVTGKNPLLRQLYADCLGLPVSQSASAEGSVIGAAIFGAVAGGVHSDALSAQQAMQAPTEKALAPNAANASVYDRLYGHYRAVHDSFGGRGAPDLGLIMKDLIALRRTQRQGHAHG